MKFMHLSALALAGTMTVLAIGCAKTKDNSTETPLHNYTLKEACDTKPIVSESPDQDCAAIQEAIATGCEIEKRKAIFKKRCAQESDLTTATTSTTIPVFTDEKDQKTNQETTLFKTLVLDDGKKFSAAIKLNVLDEKSATNLISVMTTIRCADNLELAMNDLDVVLVGDGKVVVTKEMDQDKTENETGIIQLECISTEKKSLDLKGLTENKISMGQSVKDATLSQTEQDGKVVGHTTVSCHEDSTKAALSGKNGLQLVKGTTVLVNNSKGEVSLYSCQ